MFLYICEGELKICVKGSSLMLKEIANYFETILLGLMELAPVVVTVKSDKENIR